MNKAIYRRVAEVICFICHGRCCKEGMIFEYDGNKAICIEKDYTKCLSWDRLTGRCRSQSHKPEICRLWKCWLLNIVSRLLKQRVWDGTM